MKVFLSKFAYNSMFACGVFIDHCKTFDGLNHKILSKLEYYGICGLQFWSYLKSRYQFISVNNVKSDLLENTYGFSQGFVFFVIFNINISISNLIFKNGPKWQKFLSATLYISGTIYHIVFIYGTHKCIKR